MEPNGNSEGGMHGPSSLVLTSSIIVSGPAGLWMSQVQITVAAHPGHHYGDASISAILSHSNIQPTQGANYVMTGGQPLLVSGPSMMHPLSLGPRPAHRRRRALYGRTERQFFPIINALNYLHKVKCKFRNQPQVYKDFLDIMKKFKSRRIGTRGVISRVSKLFRGHWELVVGFNKFLPRGLKCDFLSDNYSDVSD